MRNFVIFILLLALLVGVGSFYFSKKQVNNTPINQDITLVTPTPIQSDNSSESSEIAALLERGGSYTDSQGVFSIFYPNEYTVDQPTPDNPYVRFSKRGEQQRPQSEMSDGVLVVIEAIDLQGKTLEEYVDSRIQADLTNSEVIQPKRATTFKGYEGFTYEMSGLGSTTYLVLQKDVSSPNAISIAYLVADPRQLGYQAEVDTILSTLDLLK